MKTLIPTPARIPKELHVLDRTSLASCAYFYVGGKYEEEAENTEKIPQQNRISCNARSNVRRSIFPQKDYQTLSPGVHPRQ
jgi:hypothetical protein